MCAERALFSIVTLATLAATACSPANNTADDPPKTAAEARSDKLCAESKAVFLACYDQTTNDATCDEIEAGAIRELSGRSSDPNFVAVWSTLCRGGCEARKSGSQRNEISERMDHMACREIFKQSPQ